MSGLINSIIQKYNYVFHELADPRTKDWWGVSNPFLILAITSSYVYFCTSLGPRLMQHRKPFQLKTVLQVYNVFQILFSIFLVYEGYIYMFDKRFSWSCEPIDYSNTPRGLRIAGDTWFYFIAKITELLDTIFFVLRKKYKQVTFLHVYHHTIMSFVIWIGAKYLPGGHIVLLGTLNSLVHVIMYTYYLISSFGPQYQKYVWWKKHLTLMQLIQFLIIFVHNSAVFFYECRYPRALNALVCVNAVAFIYMFGDFYIRSYKRNSSSKAALESKTGTSFRSNVNKYYSNGRKADKSR